MKTSILALIAFLVAFLYAVVLFIGIRDYFISIEKTKEANEMSDKYVKNLHLKFSGKIIDCDNFSDGFGLLRLTLSYSSKDYYDVRPQGEKYFAIIKYGKAEIISSKMTKVRIGDSVVIDTEKNSYKIYRSDSLIIDTFPSVNYSSFFYKALKKHHRL